MEISFVLAGSRRVFRTGEKHFFRERILNGSKKKKKHGTVTGAANGVSLLKRIPALWIVTRFAFPRGNARGEKASGDK